MARYGATSPSPTPGVTALPPGTHASDTALDPDASLDTDFGNLSISERNETATDGVGATFAARVADESKGSRPFKPLPRRRHASGNTSSGLKEAAANPAAPQAPAYEGPLRPLRKTELTIVLVGETGVGKSCFMSLLANVCAGRGILHFKPEHNPENDTKLPESQSQTKAAMLYEMERPDGVRIRVLDTPGLCDTRGIEQDAAHKASIAHAIREHVVQVDAVIVMANGTNKRLTVPTDYALNTLSAMFPASIASNICFLFTNVDNPLTFNFSTATLPAGLRDAELFMLQNPLALLLNYQLLDKRRAMHPEQSKAYENLLEATCQATIAMLNDLFKWADECTSQPTADISRLYDMTVGIEATIADVIARLDQMEAKKKEIQVIHANLATSTQVMKINEQFERVMSRKMHVQCNTPDSHTTQCTVAGCYSNCHKDCNLAFLLDPAELGRYCYAFTETRKLSRCEDPLDQLCTACGHEAREHRHFHSVWDVQTRKEKVVDKKARQSYSSAEQEVIAHENQMHLIGTSLAALDVDIERLELRLDELCTEFHAVALTGSFVGHIAATIHLLELRREAKRAAGDVDGERALTKTIESFQARIHVLQEVERKKKEKWSFTRLASAVADRLPRIRWK